MAFIPDLQDVRHNLTPVFFRLSDAFAGRDEGASVPPDLIVQTVGWLGDIVESRGATPDECIRILLDAYEAGHRFSDGTMGSHTCEICPPTTPQHGYHHPFAWKGRDCTLYGHGHHFVLHGQFLFICPALILHYIVDHQYQPPAVFIDAVVRGEILKKGPSEFYP